MLINGELYDIIPNKKFPMEFDMNNNYPQIQELLHQKADLQARLKLLPYDGNPEIKERDGKKYLYIRY